LTRKEMCVSSTAKLAMELDKKGSHGRIAPS
jgi:hypothetical protein